MLWAIVPSGKHLLLTDLLVINLIPSIKQLLQRTFRRSTLIYKAMISDFRFGILSAWIQVLLQSIGLSAEMLQVLFSCQILQTLNLWKMLLVGKKRLIKWLLLLQVHQFQWYLLLIKWICSQKMKKIYMSINSKTFWIDSPNNTALSKPFEVLPKKTSKFLNFSQFLHAKCW